MDSNPLNWVLEVGVAHRELLNMSASGGGSALHDITCRNSNVPGAINNRRQAQVGGQHVSALPQFHETVTIPVIGRPDGLRAIVTAEGLLGPLVGFFQLSRHQAKSQSWQRKVARSVGLLLDYLVAVAPPPDLASRRAYLSEFTLAMIRGTVQSDGGDPTGLFWRPAKSWTQVREVLRYINLFADYCATRQGVEMLNPMVEASFAERLSGLYALDVQNSHSLLKHIHNAQSAFQKARKVRETQSRRPPKVRKTKPPMFPRTRFKDLIELGYRRRGRSVDPWLRYNLRDILIVLLQRYGGLRASEPFHLFTRDVIEATDKPGHARILLFHPELGRVRYPDPLHGRIIETTRSEYLRSQYDREPRNLLIGKENAGWKDLMLSEGAPHFYTEVHWFPGDAGALFWRLFQMYVRHVLPANLSHPYLFVSLDDGPSFGQPYRLSAYYQALRDAVGRIGLEYIKLLGTTSHGFRHAYAQDLKDAKISRKIIQVCLNHRSSDSQNVYTLPEKYDVHKQMEEARNRLDIESNALYIHSRILINDNKFYI